MSREDEIAKIDAELESLGVESEETVEELEEEIDENETEEEVKEDPKPEPAAEEVVPKTELKLNTDIPESKAWYIAREETRKREALEKELAELKKPKAPSEEEDYEGHIKAEIGATKAELAELKAWKQDQEKSRKLEEDREGAFRELHGYEAEAAQAFPDFNEAANYAKSMIAASIKLLEPDISAQDLAQQTLYKYAAHAASALNNKKHPGQAIYEAAAQWGYKKAEAEKPKIVIDNKLSKLGENKKKSSGMSSGGSSGKADIGSEELFKMSNAERMRLKPEDWARLEAEA